MKKTEDDTGDTVTVDEHKQAVVNDAKLVLTGKCDCPFHRHGMEMVK